MLPGIWISVNSNAISDAGFKYRKSLIGIGSFDRDVAGIFHHIDRLHAQQHFIFNDKHNFRNCGAIESHHDRGFT